MSTETKLLLSIYEKAVVNKSCINFCKVHLKDWPEARFRAVLDDNIGQMEYFEWAKEAKELIDPKGKLDRMLLAQFLWGRFKDECIDYLTGYKKFD